MPDLLTLRGAGLSWLTFYAGILAAWAALFAMAAVSAPGAGGDLYGAEIWRALCTVAPGLAGYPALLAMWALMVAAMMAPSVVPALTTYDALTRGAGFWTLLAGYAAVWLGYSALAAGAQLGLAAAALTTPAGESLSPRFTALLLLLAGLYQFSPLKSACLSRCRAPLTFFLGNWRDGSRGAVAMGVRLGLACLGCCWALMALAFVGGMTNLALMGVATILMTLEKLPQPGRHLTRPAGVALILAGGFTAGTTL